MRELPDRALPGDLDIERFVLGAILTADKQPMSLGAMLSTLVVGDFTLDAHCLLFDTCKELFESGVHVDRGTVYAEIRKRNFENVLGLSDIYSLDSGMPELYSLDSYIQILQEKTRLRRLITTLRLLENRAWMSEPSTEIIADMTSQPIATATRRSGPKTPAQIIEEAGGVNAFLSPELQMGFMTPFQAFNEEFLGFERQTLTILAARPSVGKSAWCGQVAHHIGQNGHRSVIYALEMKDRAMLRRLVGTSGRINMQRFRLGIADQPERFAAMRTCTDLVDMGDNLLISDNPKATISGIAQDLYALQAKGTPADFLCVDYLQLMTPQGKFDNRVQEVSSLSRGLKLIAGTFDIPVLALSQLNRSSEKEQREPRLDDLRDSGSLEQDSDNVIFLHRMPSPDDQVQNIRMILGKNRNGPIGKYDLEFIKRYTRFATGQIHVAGAPME